MGTFARNTIKNPRSTDREAGVDGVSNVEGAQTEVAGPKWALFGFRIGGGSQRRGSRGSGLGVLGKFAQEAHQVWGDKPSKAEMFGNIR